MIIYRPAIKVGDTFMGDVCRYNEEGLMLEGCGYNTSEAKSWEQAEREALKAVGWE